MITLFYAGFIGLIMLGLGGYIVSLRRRHQVSLGEGEQTTLTRASRAFGNTTEWLPITLLLLALLEQAYFLTPWQLHVAGVLLVLGRVSHSFGLIYGEPVLGKIIFRQLGMFATWLVLLVAAVAALLQI